MICQHSPLSRPLPIDEGYSSANPTSLAPRLGGDSILAPSALDLCPNQKYWVQPICIVSMRRNYTIIVKSRNAFIFESDGWLLVINKEEIVTAVLNGERPPWNTITGPGDLLTFATKWIVLCWDQLPNKRPTFDGMYKIVFLCSCIPLT